MNSSLEFNRIDSEVRAQIETFGVLDRQFLGQLKEMYQAYLKELVKALINQGFNAQVVVSYFGSQGEELGLEQLMQMQNNNIRCKTVLRTTPIPVPHQKAFLDHALLLSHQMPPGSVFATSYHRSSLAIAQRQVSLATLQVVWSDEPFRFS